MSKARKVIQCFELALLSLGEIGDGSSAAHEISIAGDKNRRSNELYEVAYKALVSTEQGEYGSVKRSRVGCALDYSFTTLYNAFRYRQLL